MNVFVTGATGLEARRRLLTESLRAADREAQEAASHRKRSFSLAEALEQGGYWLIWAAVLTALALGMFS